MKPTATGQWRDEKGKDWTLVGDVKVVNEMDARDLIETPDNEALFERANRKLSRTEYAEAFRPTRVQDGKVYELSAPDFDLVDRSENTPAPETTPFAGDIRRSTPGGGDGQLEFETIIGADDRYYEFTHTTFPARATGAFTGVGCTGFFVGPRTILTAAHCVWNRAANAAIAMGNFMPGRHATAPQQPWGQWTVNTFYFPTIYKTVAEADRGEWDFAVLDLTIAAGWTGSPGWYGLTTADGGFNVLGYPGDKPNGEMWGKSGNTDGTTGNNRRWKHKIDCVGGDSGAALRNVSNQMTGIHTQSGTSVNYARKYDTYMYNFIRDYSVAW